MAVVMQFVFRLPSDDVLETLTINDDCSVIRAVAGGAEEGTSVGATEIGWWSGEVEPSVLEMISSVALTPPTAKTSRPAAAGDWWAIAGDAHWRVSSTAGLVALLAVVGAAASRPQTVVSAEAWLEHWDGEPAPVVMMRLRAAGEVPGDVRFDDPPDAPVAAFVTDGLETLGFLGSTFTVSPPVEAVAVLRDRPPVDGRLILTGTLEALSDETAKGVGVSIATPSAALGDESGLTFRLLVGVGDHPPEP